MTKDEIGMLDAIVGNPNFGNYGNYELENLKDNYGLTESHIAVLVREGLWEMRTSEFYGFYQYYYSFTDIWREVKKQGNYRAYLRWLEQQDIEAKQIQELNKKVMQITVISGTIARRLYFATVWIALASCVAALYYSTGIVEYFSGLIAKHLPLFYGAAVTAYLLSLGGLIGASTTFVILRRRKHLKKPNPIPT